MDVVSAITNVVQEIVKAAVTARNNKKRCLDLADRAQAIVDLIHNPDDSSTASTTSSGSGRTMIMREPFLNRLKAVLDEALKLVESQQPGGFVDGGKKLITSTWTADKFVTVDAKITACVTDFGLAEQFAARHRACRANKGTHSAPSPAPERHQQSFLSTPGSSQQHQSSQPATSLLQPRRSSRLLQQNQRFQSEESSTQQQRSSQPPLQQQHRSLGLPSSQQQQHQSSQPAASNYHRRTNRQDLSAREIVSAIQHGSSQPKLPPRGAGAP